MFNLNVLAAETSLTHNVSLIFLVVVIHTKFANKYPLDAVVHYCELEFDNEVLVAVDKFYITVVAVINDVRIVLIMFGCCFTFYSRIVRTIGVSSAEGKVVD